MSVFSKQAHYSPRNASLGVATHIPKLSLSTGSTGPNNMSKKRFLSLFALLIILVLISLVLLHTRSRSRGPNGPASSSPPPPTASQPGSWRVCVTECVMSANPGSCVRIEVFGGGKHPAYATEFESIAATNWIINQVDESKWVATGQPNGIITLERVNGRWRSRMSRASR